MSDTRDCGQCGKADIRVRKDGTLWRHWDDKRNETCSQDQETPGTSAVFNAPTVSALWPIPCGPWVSARFDSECDTCDGSIFEGDEIRSDGSGGWECDRHKHVDEPAPQPVPIAAPVADLFTAPTVVVQPAPELNVSGQPRPRYQWHGKQNRGYLVKLPGTGEFRRYKNGNAQGITRATTFNKAATDQNSLSDWGKRNVLIGASKRPDLVAQANGLTHENRNELMSLVGQLEEVAGSKVASQIGVDIHELTERIDGGAITLDDVPAVYRGFVELYLAELDRAQLRPVPGLIERTVYIPEFGGVVGTFDRVYEHVPSGRYLIGDVKTGKTLDYGMDEIETQEWIYAHGFNLYGVYDWNTDTWVPPGAYGDSVQTGPWSFPERVSEEWGVILHLPVDGDDKGTCRAVRADLQRGARHAQVCHDVRVQRSNKPKPEAWTGEELGAVQEPEPAPESPRLHGVVKLPIPWADVAYSVRTRDDAGKAWQEAANAGLSSTQLDRLTEIMTEALKISSVTS